MKARAVIAEDEPLLAESLRGELALLWPGLEIAAIANNGEAAVHESLAQRPDVVFLDIRMPGMSGLEAAEALAEDWPDGAPFPLLVFVTAYDQYALQAFERAAVDYVLKPVQPARLAATVQRLQAALAARAGASPASELGEAVERLRGLLGPAWFLPVAEESGLIDDLGRWVLTEAVRIAGARLSGAACTRYSVSMTSSSMRPARQHRPRDALLSLSGRWKRWSRCCRPASCSTGCGRSRRARRRRSSHTCFGLSVTVATTW